MSQRNSVVQLNRLHKIYRGDRMKYAATYKHGNTTIHIVAPPPMAEKDKQKVIRDMHMAGWAIIDEIIENGISKLDRFSIFSKLFSNRFIRGGK